MPPYAASSLPASAGTTAGLQLAHFIQRFGNRGVTNLWELFEGGGTGLGHASCLQHARSKSYGGEAVVKAL